ncbi:MAG: hypothetical protein JOS17DRAFT_737066 [Linnemannia elongata]|nr:MAG: hypothetical protein JOS17DRAFT_737066 [Linnemannia elongata]
MARSTTLLLFLLLTLITLLPILNHHIHVLAAPLPIPVPIPVPIPTTNEPALAIDPPNPSAIEKRQLLGSLLGGLPSFRNEGGIVPGGNTANIGAR